MATLTRYLFVFAMVAHAHSAVISRSDAQPLLNQMAETDEKLATTFQILTLDNANFTEPVNTLLNTFYNTSSSAYDIVKKRINETSVEDIEEELNLERFFTLLRDRVRETDISESIQQAIDRIRPEAERVQAYFTILSRNDNGTLSLDRVRGSFQKLKDYLSTQWQELVEQGGFSESFDAFIKNVAKGSRQAQNSLSETFSNVVSNVTQFVDSIDFNDWKEGFESVRNSSSTFFQKVANVATNIGRNWSWSTLLGTNNQESTTIVPRIVIDANGDEK